MRKLNSQFETNFVSEEGTYLENKDYFAYVELDDYACYVVADGIDEDSEVSSAQIVVSSFIKDFTDKPSMKKSVIKKYLNNANVELRANSKNIRLKASITVVITDYSKLVYSSIGNARFYLFKDGYLKIKSEDNSLTQQLVDEEAISLDKMAKHIERNNLASYLGENTLKKPFISKKIKLADSDVFALLTKGIWENADEYEVQDALEGAKEPKDVVDNIEEIILSKQPETIENYTLAVTFVNKVYINPKKSKTIKNIIMAAIPILLVIAIIAIMLIVRHNKKEDNIAVMEKSKNNAAEYISNDNIVKANEEYKIALDIAQKYKIKNEAKILDSDFKYTEIVNTADGLLEQKKYDDALDQYLLALEKGKDADNLAKEYIERKINIVRSCINVVDLLALGAKQVEVGSLPEAETTYKQARDLALNFYLKDEKKEAIAKLEEIYGAKAQADDKKKAADDKKAEEEKKVEDDKAKLQASAVELRKNGDTQYIAGDYVGAKMYYTLAKEALVQAKSASMVEELDTKIALMNTKIDESASKKAKADQYVASANEKYLAADLNSAKVLYILAKEIYDQLGLVDQSKKVAEKQAVVDAAIAAKSAK